MHYKPKPIRHRGEVWWIVTNQADQGYVCRFYRGRSIPWRFRTRALALRHIRRDHNKHPTRRLVFDGRRVKIDEKIVPLLKATWALGLRTELSCQNQRPYEFGRQLPGRWAMIKLPVKDSVRWLRIAGPRGSGERSRWSFSCYPSFKSSEGPPVSVAIFIYFRWSEYGRVIDRLKQASLSR